MTVFGLSAIMMYSLFLSPQECQNIDYREHSNGYQNPTEKEDMPLVLHGILCRPDLNHWIVWINDTRIYSQRPQSIQGWTIIKVHSDSVVVRSKDGEERELRPEQDSDLEEFNRSMDGNTTEDLEMNEADQNDVSTEDTSEDSEIENSHLNENVESSPMGNGLTSQTQEKAGP